jgi:hypothetical protein
MVLEYAVNQYFYRLSKRQYCNFTRAHTKKTLKAYKAGTMSFNRYSEAYDIPKPTLKHHLDGKVLREKQGTD